MWSMSLCMCVCVCDCAREWLLKIAYLAYKQALNSKCTKQQDKSSCSECPCERISILFFVYFLVYFCCQRFVWPQAVATNVLSAAGSHYKRLDRHTACVCICLYLWRVKRGRIKSAVLAQNLASQQLACIHGECMAWLRPSTLRTFY